MSSLTTKRLREILQRINSDSKTVDIYSSKLNRMVNFLRNNTGFKTAAVKEGGARGKKTTPKKRFGAAERVGIVRDIEARGFLIRTEDEGEESLGFKLIMGLAEQEDHEKPEEAKPIYDGTQDEELTSEEILRLLEKMPVPEGFEREFVIVNNEIFRYKEYATPSYNADILEKKVFSLKEEIDDGTYTFEDCLPRILFSYNKIKIIEFLKKKDLTERI